MLKTLFRADASSRIGAGHVMRCLALAQATDRGAEFASAEMLAGLARRIDAEGIAMHRLQVGVGGDDDVAATIDRARAIDAKWVVLDGYAFDGGFQRRLKDAGFRVLAVDDYGHAGRYAADLVLNQNLGADPNLYGLREPNTRLLLGPRYAMLRPEFVADRPSTREAPAVASRILVSFGGADPDNVTLKATEAILLLTDVDVRATIVIGGGYQYGATLDACIASAGNRVRILRDAEDMPALLKEADLAIAAAGTSAWERACYGVPSLVLVLADNQRGPAAGLADAGLSWNLGWHADVSAQEIAETLRPLIQDREARQQMADQGMQMVDGRGAARVVEEMRSCELSLRPATEEDRERIWEWANEPGTRAASFNSDPIPWEAHCEWFAQRLADPDTRLLIVETEGEPIGQTRLDVDGKTATVSIGFAASQRGRGNGFASLRHLADRAFAEGIDELVALIRPDNIASLALFAAAGYEETEPTEVAGSVAKRFVLHRPAAEGA